jgi:hypothetical protein
MVMWLGGECCETNFGVIAGLDPAIHPFRKILAKMMDARVKPAHDATC